MASFINTKEAMEIYFARYGRDDTGPGAIARQPSNDNYASVNAFVLVFQRFPKIPFFAQTVSIPSVSLGVAMQATNDSVDIAVPGDKLVFEDFQLQFLLDEDLLCFNTLLEWKVEAAKNKVRAFSDFSVVKLTNQKNPGNIITFYNSFPYSLGSIDLSAQEGEDKPLVGISILKYTHYKISMPLH
jgi:hypothetical protein